MNPSDGSELPRPENAQERRLEPGADTAPAGNRIDAGRWMPIAVLVASAIVTIIAWRYVAEAETSPWLPMAVLIGGTAASGALAFLVAELARREHALKRAVTRTELALSAGSIGTWAAHLATGSVDLDARTRSIFGFPPETPVTREEMEQRTVPADMPKQRAAFEQMANPRADRQQECEYRISIDGGLTERWVAIRWQAEVVDGRAERVFGTIRDITARKVAEQELVQSRARLSGLVEQANDAIISVDRRQRITIFNQGAETMFGYSAAEVIGQPLDLLVPARVRASHRRDIEVFEQSSQGSRRMGERGEIVGLRKDGSEFPAEASISRLDVPGGPVFTAIVRDVTERKRYQAELEARVAERTRALLEESRRREAAQAALVQAQRMDALGQLTGGIAHDSNNLLTVISGNLEMLEDELEGHPALKYLREAQDAAQMGARLNQRLLTFARRRKLAPQVVNLNDQVLAMNELLRRTLGDDIRVSTSLGHDLWPTTADPSEVENAILNLALNARDAMPDGGELRVETKNAVIDEDLARLEEGFTAGDYVCLSVSDTGEGMPPEVLRRVFEPFFTTKGPGKGTGLGLSSLFGFAKQSKGHVTIYSEVGHGTKVNVFLPRERGNAAVADKLDARTTVPRGNGEMILVVEDNPQVRAVTLERLKRLGYRTREADNGPAALAQIKAAPDVDLVLSDVVMPGGMSGFDLARTLREERPGLPVLLASGFSGDADRDTDQMSDRFSLLRKPYSIAELATALRERLAP